MVVRRCLAVWLLVGPLLGSVAGAQTFRLPAGLPELLEFARADSNEATAHFWLGLAFWDAGRLEQADSALRRAVAIDPRFADAYLALSFLILQRQLVTQRPSRTPQDWRVRDDARPGIAEAVRYGRRAFMINPLVALPLTSPTRLAFADDLIAGHYDKVFKAMEDLARDFNERRRPDRVPSEVLYLRGMAAAHLEKHDVAIQDFESLVNRSLTADTGASLAVAPFRTNELRYILAVLLHLAQRLERAKQLYREAGEQDLGLYMAHVQLAGIYVEAGQFDSAIVEREAAVNSNPDDSSVQVDLALTLMQADRDFDAVAPLHRAAHLNPHDARVPYLLGVLAGKAGRHNEARRELERFIAMAPSRLADQVSDAQRRLAALPGPP